MNDKITAAKVDAILSPELCFFGSLLCNLKFTEDATCDTAWTDGTSLGFNPTFIDSLPHAEVVGLLAHEVMHCAGAHPYRRDNREPKRWNIACDYAINDILTDSGIKLPNGSLKCPAEFKGKSAEWIYDRLPASPEGGQGGKGDGQGDDMAPGEVRDSPSPDTDEEGKPTEDTMSESEWNEAARQAAQSAKQRGKLPAGMDRFSKSKAQAAVDWKSALRKFVQQNAKTDYTWTRPSYRYISQDLYLPAMHSEDMPRIAVGVDTSGSIDAVALAQAQAEIISIMDEVSPAAVDVFYCDARVAKHDVFERGEEIIFKPAGGGGTDFRPVFEAVEEMEEKPACIIYITDLYGSFPDGSDIPTIWATDGDMVAPFGETIKIGG